MFLPLRDENPSGKFAFVNIGLLAANIAVFFYQLTLTPHVFKGFVMANAMVPARVSGWVNGATTFEAAFLPLITSMFLHAGFAHILGNMLFLWIFGDNVEAEFGHLQYLLFYLVCGVGAGLVHIAFNFHSHLPALGASGAISGVMGAYIVLEPRNRILCLLFIFVIRVPAVIVLGGWFAMQFLSGISSLGNAVNGGVAVWAHIGGFLIGVLIAMAAKRH
ncbi:MAG: rhomboid family intramembrane serine protease [Acidobacteria bacterium]|jgi:membrane associated rhomboid family serine protease|nr:MAG: rhomboid family intramembrane serine protease [Acidobacteriota bacterium]